MSTTFSRFENLFSGQFSRVALDAVGQTLLQRITELLAHRPDVSRADFLRAVGRPTPSWGSEFFSGQRTTNDLRLVCKMAKFFGVTAGYLLKETEPEADAGLVTLRATWRDLGPKDRAAVLQMANYLRERRTDEPGDPPPPAQPGPGGRSSGATDQPRKQKRR